MNLGLVQTRPAGAAGGLSDHSLLSHLAYADAGHTGFLALAGAQTVTGEKLIDSTVPLRFGHAAGPTIQGPSSGPVLSLTGSLSFLMDAPATAVMLNLSALTGVASGASFRGLWLTTPSGGLAAGTDYYGFYVTPNIAIPAASTTCDVYGLWFQGFVKAGGAGTVVPNLLGGIFRAGTFGFTGTVTSARCLEIDPYHQSYSNALVTTTYGIKLNGAGYSCMQDFYGYQCADYTGNTGFKRLLELGPSTPYLRVVGGGAPGAGLSNLYLNVGGTLYQIRTQLISGYNCLTID